MWYCTRSVVHHAFFKYRSIFRLLKYKGLRDPTTTCAVHVWYYHNGAEAATLESHPQLGAETQLLK
jgi:hypothetical protein